MGRQPQVVLDLPNDPDELGKLARSYEWSARRNMLMALISAAAWIAGTAAIVWLPNHRSQVDRQQQITRSAAEIRSGYEALIRSIEPDLKTLKPDLAKQEIDSLNKLKPVEMSGYDLGTQLYPTVLESLISSKCESVRPWLSVLARVQPFVKSLEQKKDELAKDIGAAQEAPSTFTISATTTLFCLAAFVIFGSFMRVFSTQSQRCSALAILHRTLQSQYRLFANDERNLTAVRTAVANQVGRLNPVPMPIVSDVVKLMKAVREFLNPPSKP